MSESRCDLAGILIECSYQCFGIRLSQGLNEYSESPGFCFARHCKKKKKTILLQNLKSHRYTYLVMINRSLETRDNYTFQWINWRHRSTKYNNTESCPTFMWVKLSKLYRTWGRVGGGGVSFAGWLRIATHTAWVALQEKQEDIQ